MDNIYDLLNNVSADIDTYDCCELPRAESKRIRAQVLGQSGLCCWQKAVVVVCIVVLLVIACAVGFREENKNQNSQWVKKTASTAAFHDFILVKDGVSPSMCIYSTCK